MTDQPTEAEPVSARGKAAGGNASQFQNKRFVDPILKDEREDEMNDNLAYDAHMVLPDSYSFI